MRRNSTKCRAVCLRQPSFVIILHAYILHVAYTYKPKLFFLWRTLTVTSHLRLLDACDDIERLGTV